MNSLKIIIASMMNTLSINKMIILILYLVHVHVLVLYLNLEVHVHVYLHINQSLIYITFLCTCLLERHL